MHLLIESVWLSVVPLISLCAVNEAFPTVDKEQYQGAILRVAAFDVSIWPEFYRHYTCSLLMAESWRFNFSWR